MKKESKKHISYKELRKTIAKERNDLSDNDENQNSEKLYFTVLQNIVIIPNFTTNTLVTLSDCDKVKMNRKFVTKFIPVERFNITKGNDIYIPPLINTVDENGVMAVRLTNESNETITLISGTVLGYSMVEEIFKFNEQAENYLLELSISNEK